MNVVTAEFSPPKPRRFLAGAAIARKFCAISAGSGREGYSAPGAVVQWSSRQLVRLEDVGSNPI
jgi:hypothetical protein